MVAAGAAVEVHRVCPVKHVDAITLAAAGVQGSGFRRDAAGNAAGGGGTSPRGVKRVVHYPHRVCVCVSAGAQGGIGGRQGGPAGGQGGASPHRVLGCVAVDHIHEHHQAQPVRLVDHRLELLGGSTPAAGLQLGEGSALSGSNTIAITPQEGAGNPNITPLLPPPLLTLPPSPTAKKLVT